MGEQQVSPITIAAPPEALAQSEQKRQEALDWIERARRHQAEGNLEGAQSEVTNAWYCLDEALSICPTNHRARFLLVSCAMNADDYQRAKLEAVRIYQDLTREQLHQMNDSVLHLSIAHAAKMLGEIEFAIRFALEATQLYSDDPQPYMVLGELHENIGQNQEAEQKCRQALMHNDSPNCKHQLNSQNVFFTLCCLGSCLVKQGKFSEAELFIHRAIQIDSTSTLGFRHLVDVYHFQGRFQEALQAAHKIREMDPADSEIVQKIDMIRQDMNRGAGPTDPRSLPSRQSEDLPISAEAMNAPPPAGPRDQRAVQNIAANQISNQGSRAGSVTSANQPGYNYQAPGTKPPYNAQSASELQVPSQKKAEPDKKPPPKKDNEWWTICCFDRDERG